jgi:3-hydroxybutyrate dehydrogenase
MLEGQTRAHHRRRHRHWPRHGAGSGGGGPTVTITGRRADVLSEAARTTPGLHPLVMDVTDEASVEDGIAAAIRGARPGANLHSPMPGSPKAKRCTRADTAHWRRIMTTNLDGAFWTIRACLWPMRAAGWGRVIAMSSVAGLRGLKGAPAYTASKHGLIGLIRGLSEDYLGQPLTFNAVCPGYVDTEIVTRATVGSISARAGLSAEEALKIMTDPSTATSA